MFPGEKNTGNRHRVHLGVRSFIIAVTSTYLYNNTCAVSGHGHTSLPGNSPPGRVLDVQKEYEVYGQTFLPLSLLDCQESCSTGRRVGLHRRPCVVITSSYCPDKDAPGITYYALHCGKHGYAQQCPKKGGQGWAGCNPMQWQTQTKSSLSTFNNEAKKVANKAGRLPLHSKRSHGEGGKLAVSKGMRSSHL